MENQTFVDFKKSKVKINLECTGRVKSCLCVQVSVAWIIQKSICDNAVMCRLLIAREVTQNIASYLVKSLSSGWLIKIKLEASLPSELLTEEEYNQFLKDNEEED